MKGIWIFGPYASAKGAINKIAPFEIQGSDAALCDCPAFIKRLQDDITFAEEWIEVYQDSKYIDRPEELSEFVEWNASNQDELVSIVEVDGKNYSEAVRDFKKLKNERHKRDQSENFVDGKRVASMNAAAETNSRTCKVDVNTEPTGCAADILLDATMAHENLHRNACLAQQKLRDIALNKLEPSKSWGHIIKQPVNFAAHEVLGYTTQINYVKTAYQNLCGKPLP